VRLGPLASLSDGYEPRVYAFAIEKRAQHFAVGIVRTGAEHRRTRPHARRGDGLIQSFATWKTL
jgi:hypothetical protein